MEGNCSSPPMKMVKCHLGDRHLVAEGVRVEDDLEMSVTGQWVGVGADGWEGDGRCVLCVEPQISSRLKEGAVFSDEKPWRVGVNESRHPRRLHGRGPALKLLVVTQRCCQLTKAPCLMSDEHMGYRMDRRNGLSASIALIWSLG